MGLGPEILMDGEFELWLLDRRGRVIQSFIARPGLNMRSGGIRGSHQNPPPSNRNTFTIGVLGISDDNPIMVPTLMLVWYEFLLLFSKI